MKVLHFINTLSAGGAELHLLTLCRYLKNRGIDLGVACLRAEVRGSRSLRADFEKENIRVFDLNADSRYNLSFLSRLAFLVKQQRPDILHTHLPRADIAGALIFRLVKSPVFLCSVHGIYRDRWFGAWAAPFMRGGYRKAEGIIAISSAVKDWLQQELGVCSDKIRVIHYGIEPHRFARSMPDLAESGRNDCRLSIGSIGRLEPGKGFDCLINAMESLRQCLPNSTLCIAGHDPLGYGKTLKALIARLNLQEQVRIVGFQNDIASFLSRLDVFAFASRSEGFGQVLIEAMAAGKPVVASKIPPFTEIVIDGETGLLVDAGRPEAFAHAIRWLLVHPEKARQMGTQGQARVLSHFSVQKMTAETLSVYNSLLRSRRDEATHVF